MKGFVPKLANVLVSSMIPVNVLLFDDHIRSFQFGLVWFLINKTNQTQFIYIQNQTELEPDSNQLVFGSVWFCYVKTCKIS
jgi:hypothetical protein